MWFVVNRDFKWVDQKGTEFTAKSGELIDILNTKDTVIANTTNGEIKITQAHGAIKAQTHNGAIDIQHAHDNLIAQTKNGSISIVEARGAIRASTIKGDITIQDANNTVIAQTTNGCINTSCKQLKQQSKINLTTTNGTIQLALPDTCNADLQGSTKNGILTCEVPITSKPQTVKLNSAT